MRKQSYALLILCCLLISLGTGCVDDSRKLVRATLGGQSSKALEEFTGDPVALATVKTIAVVPFEYVGKTEGFDAMEFATKLANRISMRGEVRVIYPRQIMQRAAMHNRQASAHNTQLVTMKVNGEVLQNYQMTEEERSRAKVLDPITNREDAVKIARELKADAVLVGMVTDWDPYMRPSMSLSMHAIATGNSDTAAMALSEMTQWGVPRRMSTASGQIWYMQQTFDSHEPDIGRNVYAFGTMKHTEEHPHNIDIYVRSINKYYDFVNAVLTNALLGAKAESIIEAERRALAEAEKMRLTKEAARQRIRALTDPNVNLPDQKVLMTRNLNDDREKTWRPDLYNLANPDKKAELDTHIDPAQLERQLQKPRRKPLPDTGDRPEIRFE